MHCIWGPEEAVRNLYHDQSFADRILALTPSEAQMDDNAALWRERLPDARLVMVDECGHLPHVEKAAVVARHVRVFLEGAAT
jgi:pimeloyl-ACP methyl ester carboxylesterase